MEKLQVGDVIYTSKYSAYTSHKIDRVTEKNAFSGSWRFLREPDNSGNYKIIAPNKWGPCYGEKMNPRIEKYVAISQYKQAVDILIERMQKARNLPDGITIEEVRAKIGAMKTICESI